jgi:O-antigen/teichoic acid export membrane protein
MAKTRDRVRPYHGDESHQLVVDTSEDGVFPTRRVSRNGLFAIANSVVGLVSGILLIPIMLRDLGSSAYGLFALSMALAAYAGLLDFGVNATLTREVAAQRALGDRDGSGTTSTIASTAFFAYLFIGLLGAGVLLLLALPGANVFGFSPRDAALFRGIALIVAAQVGLSLPLSVWNSVLSGLQDYHVIYSISIAATIARFIVAAVLLHAGMGVVGLVAVTFFTAGGVWLANYVLARRRLPGLRIRPSNFDRAEMRRLVKFNASMLVWSFAGFSLHNADRLILGFNDRLSGIAEYDVGARLSLCSRGVVQGWLDTLMPHASELHAAFGRSSLRRTFLAGTRSLLAVYGLVAVCLFVDGGRFLQWWIGPRYADASVVLSLLVGANLFQMQNLVGHVMLVGMGRLRAFTVVMVCYSPVVMLLGWFASARYGARGMAGAILVSVVVLEGAFMPYVLREFSVPFREFLRLCQAPVLCGIVGGVVLGSLTLSVTGGAALPAVARGAAATSTGYVAGYLIAMPARDKRAWLLGLAKRCIGGR